MKVCVFYKTIDKPWGGANSFIMNLKRYLKTTDLELVDSPDDADVVLLNGAYKGPGKMLTVKAIKRLKNTGYISWFRYLLSGFKKRPVKILYRLDGLRKIYANIESKMDIIQLSALEYVDHIIFQSQYSLDVFRLSGYKQDKHTVISNGVNEKIFKPDGKSEWQGNQVFKFVACSWSKNSAKGHKIIADISNFDNVEVEYVGNWPEGQEDNNVKLHGPATQSVIAEKFKNAHGFLFPSKNEACSNILLEALACGLPAFYSDSGGNREIANNYGIAIEEDNLTESLNIFKTNYHELKRLVCKDTNKFSINQIGNKYYQLIKSLQL